MSKQVKWRRGTTAEHSTFIGAVGEVTVDTSKDTLVVHDGITLGGHSIPEPRDWQGFTAELFAQAGIVPNGAPDRLGASQRVDAMRKMFSNVGTVSDIASGKFKVGARVSIPERNYGNFLVGGAGAVNGADILDAGNGASATLIYGSGEIDPEWFGIESQGYGPNITRLFDYCNANGRTIKAESIHIDQTLPVCNLDVGTLTFDRGGINVGVWDQDLSIKIGKLSGPTNASTYFAVWFPVGSQHNIVVDVGAVINPEIQLSSFVVRLDKIFYFEEFNRLDFHVGHAESFDRLLRADKCKKVSIRGGSCKNYLTAYWIQTEDFEFDGPTGVNSTSFETLVLASGIPLNGRDLILGGGSKRNVIKNSNSTTGIERGYYLQLDGTDNTISNIIEDRELKVTGLVENSNTLVANVFNSHVSHTLTGTFPLTAYDAAGVTFTDVNVNTPVFGAPFQFYNITFLVFNNSNVYAPMSQLLGSLSNGNRMGQTNIREASSFVLMYIVDFSNFYQSGPVYIQDSGLYLKGPENFGLYTGNATAEPSTIDLTNTTLRCDTLGTLNTENVTVRMNGVSIRCNDIALPFLTSHVVTPQCRFLNTEIRSSALLGIPCNFRGQMRSAKVGGQAFDGLFISFEVDSITAPIALPIINYVCEGNNGGSYFKFMVSGTTVTDLIGTHTGKVIVNTTDSTLTVGPTVMVRISILV